MSYCESVSQDCSSFQADADRDGDSMEAYDVRCVEIRKVEKGLPVKAKTRGPLTVVLLLGCSFSAALLALSIAKSDGMSTIATVLLSFLSTVIGVGNKSTLNLVARNSDADAPPGDVVIRYPKGSFHVVKCSEDVARELYFAPEEIEYQIKQPAYYRLVSLVGTVLLMFGVIALSNATVPLQIAWAVAYILLNAAYWIVAALPPRYHWELSSFAVEDLHLESRSDERNKSFTQALWKAIALTKSTDWVRLGKSAPRTEAWNCWLTEAETAANTESDTKSVDHFDQDERKVIKLPDWDPREALNRCLRDYSSQIIGV